MAKVKVIYPQITINEIEIEIPDNELYQDLDFETKFDLITKYSKGIPSYDEPDYHLCKSGNEIDAFKIIIIENENKEQN